MANLRVIVISSIRPEPTSGGQIVLHRHLVGVPGIEVEVFGYEPTQLSFSSLLRRLAGRLNSTRFHRLGQDFWALWAGKWLDPLLPRRVVNDGKTVVLTVAQGDACMAALRFARKHNLPLVTFFHDWWPDMPMVHRPFQRRLENDFQRLYQSSNVALCVSEGMKAALGEHANAPVLYPISNSSRISENASALASPAARPLKVYYSGNLFEYGPMLGEALTLLQNQKEIRLEVRGANPRWPVELKEAMQEQGFWRDFVPRSELNQWLLSADVFLTAMVFDPKMQRRMATSFPSKLIEYAQLGKPLVIWGPEDCSAIRWAQQGKYALCVTDPNPVALCKALENLARSQEEQKRLAAAAHHAAQTEFNPNSIQAQFMEVLQQVTAEKEN